MKYGSSPGSNLASNNLQSGSSLIEALLALVILGFGLLAIGKFQITLANAIGTGRDRVEALFLAQEEIDRLRAFDVIDVPATPLTSNFAYTQIDGMASGALDNENYVAAFNRGTTVTTNPVSLTWAGTPSVTPDLKLVLVAMTWNNKQGAPQALTLPSVIAKHDPSDAAWLIACQTDAEIRCGTKDVIKTPYNRNLRIPYPAKDLTGGKSAFAPPGSPNVRLVFNNDTGIIENRCTDADANINNDALADLTNGNYTGCTDLNGYLLSGYLSAGDNPRDPPSFNSTTGGTTTIGGRTSISVAPNITQGTLVECFDDSDVSVKLSPGIISYLCIITPVVGPPVVWSGTLTVDFSGTGVSVGPGASNVKVCRFGIAGVSDGSIKSNRAHPQTYLTVTESLENQNFIVIKSSKDCVAANREILHQS